MQYSSRHTTLKQRRVYVDATQGRYVASTWYVAVFTEIILCWKLSKNRIQGPTMSLVNDSLKFTLSDTQICWNFLLKKKCD